MNLAEFSFCNRVITLCQCPEGFIILYTKNKTLQDSEIHAGVVEATDAFLKLCGKVTNEYYGRNV